jgi:hypothetical protein
MNIELKRYFALGLQCSNPVIFALDFAFKNGDMHIIWSLFVVKLGQPVCRMHPEERAHYRWGPSMLDIIFADHSFDVRLGALNWQFRYGDDLEKINSVAEIIKRFKTSNIAL